MPLLYDLVGPVSPAPKAPTAALRSEDYAPKAPTGSSVYALNPLGILRYASLIFDTLPQHPVMGFTVCEIRYFTLSTGHYPAVAARVL